MKRKPETSPGQQTEKPKSRFRLELNRHNHRIVITDAIDKGRYVSYVISYYVDGRRKQIRRATLAEAKHEASFVLTKLAQGEPDILTLTSTDRLIYLRACETLSKINVPLDVAVSQFVHAETLLNGIGTVADSKIRGNLLFCHESVLKRNFARHWWFGLVLAMITLCHLGPVAFVEFVSAKHILNRTANRCPSRTLSCEIFAGFIPGTTMEKRINLAGTVGVSHPSEIISQINQSKPHDYMANKSIAHLKPETIDEASLTLDYVTHAVTDSNNYWIDRVKNAFIKAGFAVHRLEREPHHPVWIVWLKVGSGQLPVDKRVATKQLRKSLAAAGLKIGPDVLTILERRADALKLVFVYGSVVPAIDLLEI